MNHRVVAAELLKIRTLPAAVATALGTVAVAAALAAVAELSEIVVFVQIGPVLLGVLAVTSEYTGTQVRTTLIAIPDRMTALVGKTVAFLVVVSVTSGAACAAALLAGGPAPADGVVGVVAHLVLVGLLAFAVAQLVRALVPALVGMLSLLLVGGPLLASLTEHARWLPDGAGRALYLPGSDAVLMQWAGGLVFVGWIAVVGGGAAWTFLARDA